MSEQRWYPLELIPKNRPAVMYTYWVTGKGPFPYDMLRYDQAWPLERVGDLPRDGNRSIKLCSYKRPTVERWLSFWWSVGLDPIG